MPIDYKLQLTSCVKIIKKAKYVLQIHTDVLFCFSGQNISKMGLFIVNVADPWPLLAFLHSRDHTTIKQAVIKSTARLKRSV